MVPDNITPTDPSGRPQPSEDRSPKTVPSDPEFRRMLERLEELARQGRPAPAPAPASETGPDTPEDFLDAMKKADDDYVAAMDLRRKLEEAYRRSQP